MKKEILEALTTKFPGVATSVLDRIATKLARTVTTAEQVKTAVEGVTIQQVIDSYTDSRVTEASDTARKNAVSEYETRYGLKDGVKTTNSAGGDPQNNGGATNPQTDGGNEVLTLLKRMGERLDRMEASKTTDSRKQQLNAIISKLPETLQKPYERLSFDGMKDEDFNTMLGEITTEVDGIVNENNAKGGVFGTPSANNGGSTTKNELSEAQKAAIAKRDGVTANGEQPF